MFKKFVKMFCKKCESNNESDTPFASHRVCLRWQLAYKLTACSTQEKCAVQEMCYRSKWNWLFLFIKSAM